MDLYYYMYYCYYCWYAGPIFVWKINWNVLKYCTFKHEKEKFPWLNTCYSFVFHINMTHFAARRLLRCSSQKNSDGQWETAQRDADTSQPSTQSDRNEPEPTDQSKNTEHCLANDLMDRIWLLVEDWYPSLIDTQSIRVLPILLLLYVWCAPLIFT